MMDLPSPVELLAHPIAQENGLRWLLKRDDQIHPQLSGNKFRKLRDNLRQAKASGCTQLASFGGAYSNHIAAVAAAGAIFGFSTIGFIRGEAQTPLNPTLQTAVDNGMELRYLDRTTYRNRNAPSFQAQLLKDHPKVYLIPEGGTNAFALPGCAAIIEELKSQLDTLPDYITLPCGTGGTLAGLASGLAPDTPTTILGFPVLKGGFMTETIQQHLSHWSPQPNGKWKILEGYHFGGYARHTPALVDFINAFKTSYGVPLDPIYTGKHFWGVLDKMKEGYFPAGSTIVSIHTGGLQGIAGFNQRFGNLLT
jgi:1-aminocyclopropane-1-carboxylate deaminase